MSSQLTSQPKTWSVVHPEETAFWEQFDTDYIADFADKLIAIGQCDLGFRLPGTDSGRHSATLIADEMRRLGLQDVRTMPFPVHGWDFKGARVELKAPKPRTFVASSYAASPGTPAEGLTAEVVDVSNGTAADYLGRDVRGKIAFVHMDFKRLPWIGTVAYEAELHGAIGVIMYYRNEIAQHESGQALNAEDGNLRDTIPVLHLCRQDGEALADLLASGPMEATLYCDVVNRPDEQGLNVVGVLPGARYPDRYLIIQAHYDAWFYGYWDNAIGVGGILAIAKALIESGYRPWHTILFISTDAEEFGAPDTAYGWLIGCHRLLEAHPEWPGRVTCAFNIDTLAHRWQDGIQFIGPAEMVGFLRTTTAGYQATHFSRREISIKEEVTPWTETYNYAYFGIPCVQPRFDTTDDRVRTTVYHTQFDDASLVDRQRASEILRLYGTLLIRLDRQPVVTYSFTERVRSLRDSLVSQTAQAAGADLAPLEEALAAFEAWAIRIEARIRELNAKGETLSPEEATLFNDYLREVARILLPPTHYIEGDDADQGQYEHLLWQRELLALDKAITCLEQGDAQGAIAALTDSKHGVQGGWYALHTSYPAYYRNTSGARNPARPDLFWGRGRTIPFTDVWIELHSLRDKHQRKVTNFAPEIYNLREKRKAAAAGYRAALERLRQVLLRAIGEE